MHLQFRKEREEKKKKKIRYHIFRDIWSNLQWEKIRNRDAVAGCNERSPRVSGMSSSHTWNVLRTLGARGSDHYAPRDRSRDQSDVTRNRTYPFLIFATVYNKRHLLDSIVKHYSFTKYFPIPQNSTFNLFSDYRY